MINNWDRRFFRMAELVATWSKDPLVKVGVVITKNNRIVSTGFNGLPTGWNDSDITNSEVKKELIIHAEQNAILSGGLLGDTLYSTVFPCGKCMGMIIQSEITRVVTSEIGISTQKYLESQNLADKLAGLHALLIEIIETVN